jgi:hypothetical protein
LAVVAEKEEAEKEELGNNGSHLAAPLSVTTKPSR